MKYVRDNFGDSYLDKMILAQSPKRLREVLPYLESNGYLEGLLGGSCGILTFKLDEIKERERVIIECGDEVIPNGKFNSIFGLSRKRYKEKYKDVIERVNNGNGQIKK